VVGGTLPGSLDVETSAGCPPALVDGGSSVVDAYLALFGHREARWPLLTSTLSRITPGMIALAIVLLVREGGYSYAVAGLVTASHQLGVGLAAPIQGRLADRFGQPQVLRPDAAVYLLGTLGLVGLVGAGAPVAALVGVTALAGAFYPPVTPCSRVVLSTLFPGGRLRETAFAVSSIAVELGFIVGPLVAVGLAATVGAGAAVSFAGIVAFVGALAYAATGAAKAAPVRGRRTERGGALRSVGVRVMVVAFGAIAVAFGVIDIVVPAVAELLHDDPRVAGYLIASIASGSLLGGVVYGSRVWPGTVASRLRVLAVVLALGLAVVPLALASVPLFALGLFVGGIFLGPTTICAFQLIDDLALPGTQTEAQSWTQSSVVAGVALGASLSGLAVEAGGPAVALLAGAGCVGLGAAIINLRAGRLVPSRAPVPAAAP
jgi:MFS family permease